MRTTLTLDDDVWSWLRSEVARRHKSMRVVVNEVLRQGLSGGGGTPGKKRKFVMTTVDVGRSLVGSLDKIQDVLDEVEGPFRP